MIYAAFRGKNEYDSDKIGEKSFFCNMNRCWATVHCGVSSTAIEPHPGFIVTQRSKYGL